VPASREHGDQPRRDGEHDDQQQSTSDDQRASIHQPCYARTTPSIT